MTGAAASAIPIEAVDLRRSFEARVAVDGLSLHVAAGEIYGLVGPDGAGKTTTLRMLAGLLDPTSGRVRLVGQDPFGNDAGVRETLGYMPQQYSLYGDLTVAENLAFFREMFCLPREAFRVRRERLLAITRLAEFKDRRAEALSGGMYKKLALACALLNEPKVLLARRADQRRRSGEPPRVLGSAPRVPRRGHGHRPRHAVHGRGRALPPRRAALRGPAAGGGHPRRDARRLPAPGLPRARRPGPDRRRRREAPRRPGLHAGRRPAARRRPTRRRGAGAGAPRGPRRADLAGDGELRGSVPDALARASRLDARGAGGPREPRRR